MARETTFAPGTVVSSTFLNDRQDLESALMFIRVEPVGSPPTSIRVPVLNDGSAAPQTPAIINGQPRVNATAYVMGLSSAGQGSQPITFDVYATVQGTPISGAGGYGFILQLVGRTGGSPYGGAAGAAPANSRKVAELDWTGSLIQEVRNTIELAGHASQHRFGGGDPLPAGSIDVSMLAASALNKVAFTGDFKFSLQAADHGPRGDGTFEWLLVTGGTDGNGRAVSRASYGTLYAAMGSPAVDGSGNFRLPPVSGRMLIAAGQGATDASGRTMTNRVAGTTGGEELHGLTRAEGPPHNHFGFSGWMSQNNPHGHGLNWSDPGHGHNLDYASRGLSAPMSGGSGSYWQSYQAAFSGSSNVYVPCQVGNSAVNNSGGTSQSVTGISASVQAADINHYHPIPWDGGSSTAPAPGSMNSAGTVSPHNNMPPWYGMSLFVKS